MEFLRGVVVVGVDLDVGRVRRYRSSFRVFLDFFRCFRFVGGFRYRDGVLYFAERGGSVRRVRYSFELGFFVGRSLGEVGKRGVRFLWFLIFSRG